MDFTTRSGYDFGGGTFMTYWILVAAIGAALVGCQPSDQRPQTVRERVLAGEFVEFTKPGYTLCGRNAWTDMQVGDLDERERVILGKQGSFINPGHSACYRVGDTINLAVFGRDKTGGGRVRIDRVALVRLDKLKAKNLKGRFFSTDDSVRSYGEKLNSRMKPEYEGIVTVVDFTYVGGTAADEAEVRAGDVGDGYEEAPEGKSLSQCRTGWNDLSLPAEWIEDARAGRLKSGYQFGERNCFTQGQTANLKSGFGDKATVVAKVRIVKLKKFRVRALDPKFFSLDGFDYATLSARVALDNKKNEEFMTVTDFEVLP